MLRAKQDPEEDIFKDSTMTFGEHLEELRRCLFKAVLGLVGGVLIGMFFGGWAVAVIEKPLYDALHAYYTNISLDHANSPLQKKLIEAGFLPDEIYIEPDVLLSQLIHFFPHAFKEAPPEVPAPSENADKEEPPASSTAADSKERLAPEEDNLIKLSLWHRAANDPRLQPRSFGAHEPFMIWLKGGLLVGAILAAPWVFIQLWSFVAAGLYPHEKRYVNLYLPFSILLFFLGVAVTYFCVFGPVLKFLFRFNRWLNITPELRITEWLGFVLLLPLGFGIAFQLPLVMLFLERIGVFTVKMYVSYWRVAILVIFVIAAICTPPDPWSMSFLAIPLTLLYFGGILLCKWMPRGRGLLPVD